MNQKITCLVVDDEPLAREGLAEYVQKIPFLELVGTCESALELIKKLNSVSIDAIFLHIQKSFIVSKNAVESIEGKQVIIKDKKIAISRSNSEEIINKITQNRLLKKR